MGELDQIRKLMEHMRDHLQTPYKNMLDLWDMEQIGEYVVEEVDRQRELDVLKAALMEFIVLYDYAMRHADKRAILMCRETEHAMPKSAFGKHLNNLVSVLNIKKIETARAEDEAHNMKNLS